MILQLALCLFSSFFADLISPQLIVFDVANVLVKFSYEEMSLWLAQELQVSQEEAYLLYKKRKRCSAKSYPDSFWKEEWEARGRKMPPGWLELYEEKLFSCCLPIEGMQSLMEKLQEKGVRLAILSNTHPERAYVYTKNGFYAPFSPVVLSCEVGFRKPEREIFDSFLTQAGVKASECLFIDDKEENTDQAKALGFHVIHFQSFDKTYEQIAQYGYFAS